MKYFSFCLFSSHVFEHTAHLKLYCIHFKWHLTLQYYMGRQKTNQGNSTSSVKSGKKKSKSGKEQGKCVGSNLKDSGQEG